MYYNILLDVRFWLIFFFYIFLRSKWGKWVEDVKRSYIWFTDQTNQAVFCISCEQYSYTKPVVVVDMWDPCCQEPQTMEHLHNCSTLLIRVSPLYTPVQPLEVRIVHTYVCVYICMYVGTCISIYSCVSAYLHPCFRANLGSSPISCRCEGI